MRRSLLAAIVGGLLLASLLGAVWAIGGEGVGSMMSEEHEVTTSSDPNSDEEGVTVNPDPDTESLNVTAEDQTLGVENPNDDSATVSVKKDSEQVLTFDVSSTDELAQQLEPGAYTLSAQSDGSSVPINGEDRYEVTINPLEINLNVTIAGQDVRIENPSDTTATVWATHEETDDEKEITIPAETTESPTLDRGNYTLTGAADDGAVLLDGQEEISVSIAQPAVDFSVQIVNATDPVEVGESLSVTAEISNQGNEENEGEVTFDIDDPGELDETTLALAPSETETITFTYQATEDDVGERDVTVRSPSDTSVDTVEILGDRKTDYQPVDSCTVISSPGEYELVDDVDGTSAAFEDESNACIRINTSDVVLDGNDNAVIGAGAEGTIGVLVAGTEDTSAENVTIRNLRAEDWDTGINIGIEYDNRGDARLEGVTANENEGTGIYVEHSDGVAIEATEATRNGGSGIIASEEGDVDSMVDITASENDGTGIAFQHTSDLVAEEITVSENGGSGLFLGWRVYTSEFTDVTATNNDGHGLHLDTDVNSNEFSEITSSDNAERGIYLHIAGGNVFRDSTIENNGDVGIRHLEDGSEYQKVSVHNNENGQVETLSWAPITASELQIGDTAEFGIDDEPVSLDAVNQNELAELPDDVRALDDGIEVEGIEDSVDVTLNYDEAETDGQVELWRYDGKEWVSEETINEADGSLESTLTRDGIYVPVLIDEE